MKHSLVGIGVGAALLCVVVFTQNGAAQNQTPNPASIAGRVVDPAGAAIAGTRMELVNQQTAAQYRQQTDEQGDYRFEGLAAGTYDLTAFSPGFRTYAQQGLRINTNNQQLRVDITLEVGSSAESVTVTDAAPLYRNESREGETNVRVNGQPSSPPAPKAAAAVRPAGPQQGQQGQAGNIPYSQPQAANVGGVLGGFREEADRSVRWPYPDSYPGRFPIPSPGSEEYGHWAENEFTRPTDAPLSTFAVDVDTASYSNVRRFLNDNQLPPPESVRVEELINYFTYDYPLPERGQPVSLTTHVAQTPWNRGTQLMMVGLRTTPIAAEDLPASNLTFLVDVSGSMSSSDKLPLVQQALKMLVRQLRREDRVSLVVYAGSSGVVLPPTRGDQSQTILDAIDRLQAGGSTHGSEGIRLAYETARQSFLRNANNRVILATDGDFNVGVTSDSELVRLIEQQRDGGVFLSVLGFGTGNLKDSKMEKLADHGNGNYAYIDGLAEARKVFVEEMGATLFTVAKDVKLQIEFNPARVASYRLIGYENRMLRPEDFNDDTKDAGDLGAGHQVTAFYEVVPLESAYRPGSVDDLRYQDLQPQAPPATASTTEFTNEIAWVKLRYKEPQSSSSKLLEWPIAAGATAFDQAPREFRFAAAVAEYGLLLRDSKFAGNASFDHVEQAASRAMGPDLAGHRTGFLDLVRKAESLAARIPRYRSGR